jgi:hypothetical protein
MYLTWSCHPDAKLLRPDIYMLASSTYLPKCEPLSQATISA